MQCDDCRQRIDLLHQIDRRLRECQLMLNSIRAVKADGSPTVEGVIRAVANRFSVSPQALLGGSHCKTYALSRQVAMYVVREWTGMSYPAMARIFARDHSTVLHSVRKITRERGCNEWLDHRISRIMRDLFLEDVPKNLGRAARRSKTTREPRPVDSGATEGEALAKNAVKKEPVENSTGRDLLGSRPA